MADLAASLGCRKRRVRPHAAPLPAAPDEAHASCRRRRSADAFGGQAWPGGGAGVGKRRHDLCLGSLAERCPAGVGTALPGGQSGQAQERSWCALGSCLQLTGWGGGAGGTLPQEYVGGGGAQVGGLAVGNLQVTEAEGGREGSPCCCSASPARLRGACYSSSPPEGRADLAFPGAWAWV